MKKNIMIVGMGAQGSTVAKFIDKEPNAGMIVCADRDKIAVDNVVTALKNGKGVILDGTDDVAIAKAAKDYDIDIIVSGMPLEIGKGVLEAAMKAGTAYQDFCAPYGYDDNDWADGFKHISTVCSEKFKEAGKPAVCATGSAPGVICVAALKTMRYLDTCETINLMVYEGVVSKRFMPFWWSPVTALDGMAHPSWAYENGKIIRTDGFTRPIRRSFDELGKEAEFYEHAHGEAVYIGLNAESHFKGVKNVYFKYGGSGMDFARPLFVSGLLSRKPELIDGQMVIPFNVVLEHLPPAPKFKHEIKEIIDEGLISDSGAMVVEAIGKKDGKDVVVETHVMAPGMIDSFERSGLTAEMYLTGQGGAIFTKMLLNDVIGEPGLISSAMLNDEQVDYYEKCANELDITFETYVK